MGSFLRHNVEWSQFMVDYFFQFICPILLGFWGNQKFLATATAMVLLLGMTL